MSVPERTGEITAVGRILEADKALQLGDTVRALFAKYVSLPGAWYRENGIFLHDDSDLDVSALRDDAPLTNSFLIGREDQALLDQVLEKFEELLVAKGRSPGRPMDAEFFIGTAGAAEWHFDPDEEDRLLVSLSAEDLTLNVATSWGSDDYETNLITGETQFKPEGSASFHPLCYKTGEAILLDNMCEPMARVPHAGVRVSDKVFIRAIAVDPVV